jgi:hypothetical protein
MNSWRRIQIGLAATLVVSLGLMIVQAGGMFVSGLLAIWTMVAAWLLVRCESRLREQERDALLIRTINHHRHDWMNDLQVLFGYIGLRKYDILPVYVDKIKAKVMNESGLSKLGVPSLVVFLLSFRVEKRKLVLEVDNEQDIQLPQMPIDAKAVAAVIRGTVERFNVFAELIASEDGGDEANRLSLQLELEDTGLLLDFDYNGGYRERELKADLASFYSTYSIAKDAVLEFDEDHVVVTIRVPFHT